MSNWPSTAGWSYLPLEEFSVCARRNRNSSDIKE